MSHEEALQLLSSMFESYDRETLAAVFESKGYHVERTIEAIISMEQPELAQQERQQEQQERQQESSQPDFFGGSSAVQDYGFSESQGSPEPSRGAGKSRGAHIQLPDDFLRLPSSRVDQAFLEDEQLALMLQNELFQEQVDQVLGSSFRNEFRNELRPNQGLRQTGSRPGQSSEQADASGDIMGIPDMGILTSLKGMGEGMKRQLNQLALNFNSGKRGERRSPVDEESRPLTARDYSYEEEEEDEEVSNYQNSSSSSLRHRSRKND